MSTDHDNRLAQFRAAIERGAFKTRAGGARIIAREGEGQLDDWIFDFRSVVLQPAWLDAYAELFWRQYAAQYPFQVGGMETGAIPLIAAIVMKGVQRGTRVSGFYIRKSRKRDGLMKIVEGELSGEPVILVDDLINSGSSFNKQLRTLDALGARVSDIFTVLSYRPHDAYAPMLDGVRITSVFTLEDFGLPLRPAHAPEIPQPRFKEVWTYAAPSPSNHLVVAKSVPALDETRLYMGFDDGMFRAFDKKTGALAWEFPIGGHPEGKGILSSPALHGGVVFFGAYDGNVYALDCVTGAKIWSYEEADWIGSSPCIDAKNGRLFIGLEFGLLRRRGGIVCLDLARGEKQWQQNAADFMHASPLHIPQEQLVVIGGNDGILRAYDAASGAPRWSFATQSDIKSSCAYDAARRAVIVCSMDGVIYAVGARDGMPLQAHVTGAGIYGSPLVVGNTVYVGSLDKTLCAVDLATWKHNWRYRTGGRIFSSPAFFDGSVWIGSNDGRLYEFSTDGDLRGFYQSPEKIVSRAVYDEMTGCIYVTTQASEIICLQRAQQ